MIGASEVGNVKPLVKEGQHVKKVRGGTLPQQLHWRLDLVLHIATFTGSRTASAKQASKSRVASDTLGSSACIALHQLLHSFKSGSFSCVLCN
jgi:hypothetical protein